MSWRHGDFLLTNCPLGATVTCWVAARARETMADRMMSESFMMFGGSAVEVCSKS